MEKYHLFKKSLFKNGKSVTSWYYWFYDADGKQVKKTCGERKRPCLLKRDAEAFIARLKLQDDAEKKKKLSVNIEIIGTEMFTAGSLYLQLQENHGYNITQQTIDQKVRILHKYLIPNFSAMHPSEIKRGLVEDWLCSLPLSNSSKNNIKNVLIEILKECKRREIIDSVPELQPFKRKSHRKDIFTDEELKILFPEDYIELEVLWTNNIFRTRYTGIDGNIHSLGFMFGVMANLVRYTGMRCGEICALSVEQCHDNAIFIDRMVDTNREIVNHLKKGNEENTKARVVLIPSKMQQLLKYYLAIRPANNHNLVFAYEGNVVKKELFEHHFKETVKRVIQVDGRKLTPHSLRFTYNTHMVNSLFNPEALRKMIGHNSMEMTKYYTRINLEQELKGLAPLQSQIDTIWDQ